MNYKEYRTILQDNLDKKVIDQEQYDRLMSWIDIIESI